MGFISFLKGLFKAESIDFKQLVADGAKVIDVRSPSEYANGHIKDSINIPHTDILAGISKVTTSKEIPIIVYCASGGRSAMARVALRKAGYMNVVNGHSYSHMTRVLR